MPCNTYRSPDGNVTAIICSRGRRFKPCVTCGKPGPILCDYPVIRDGKQTTCDRACCRAHAESVGPDRDYCLVHAEHDRKMKAKEAGNA